MQAFQSHDDPIASAFPRRGSDDVAWPTSPESPSSHDSAPLMGLSPSLPGCNVDRIDDKLLRCRIHASKITEEGDSSLPPSVFHRQSVYTRIFKGLDAHSASRKDRQDIGLEDASLTYGEVDFVSFQSMLRAAEISDGRTFVDLGCGGGKAIIAAAFSSVRFRSCIGIELLPSVCTMAKAAVELARNAILGRWERPVQARVYSPSDTPSSAYGGSERSLIADAFNWNLGKGSVVQCDDEAAAVMELQIAMPLLEAR